MTVVLSLIIILMIIMWHCEPNMMRDIVAKGKMYYEKVKDKLYDLTKLFRLKG
tara:strand:- start:80 stop:238 length:159 start_codon:yes stop_codon:yes gene_type:complete